MSGMDGTQIYKNFTGGDPERLRQTSEQVGKLSESFKDRAVGIKGLQERMAASWTGDGASAANAGAGPLGTAFASSAGPLDMTSASVNAQASGFTDAGHDVVPVPPKPDKPSPWSLGLKAAIPVAGPIMAANEVSSYEQGVAEHNRANQNNVDTMNRYTMTSAMTSSILPTSYEPITGDGGSVKLKDDGGIGPIPPPEKRIIPPGKKGGGGEDEGRTVISGAGDGDGNTSGTGGGKDTGGTGGTGGGKDTGGTGGTGGGKDKDGSITTPSGRGGDGDDKTKDPNRPPVATKPGRTNPDPVVGPVFGNNQGGGTGGQNPNNFRGLGGPGGTPPGGGSAGGRLLGGVGAEGAGARGAGGAGAGPGAGSASGAGPGGAAANAAGRGAAGAAGARGAGGAGGPMGGAPGGRGQGGEDEEHQRPSWLVEADPDALFGTDERTMPPVIGE